MPDLFNSITRPENRPQLFLGLFLAAIGLGRLSLIGSGACSQGDEFRYWYTAQMLLGASKGDLAAALAPMFDTAGRPGLALVQLPPVILQSIVFKLTGLDPRCPDSLLIPQQVWNVLVSVAGGWLFYLVGCRVFGFSEKKSAWLTVAFSLLTASTIYVRHLLPYDIALYLFLWIFLSIFNGKKPFWIGFITAFAYSVYPGYYSLVLVVFLLFLYKNIEKPLSVNKLIKPVLYFKLGFISLLLFYEILSRISGKSFIENSLFGGQEFLHFLHLKYDGSFWFLEEYLETVQGFMSGLVFLGIGSIIFFLKTAAKILRRQPLGTLEWAAIGLLLAFVFQDAVGQFTGMKVFYGRLLRPILMAMVWLAGTVFFDFLKKPDRSAIVKYASSALVMGCFVFSFAKFFTDLRHVGYPRDMFYQFGLAQAANGLDYDIRSRTPPNDGFRRVNEFETSSYFTLPPASPWYSEHNDSLTSGLVFLNFAAIPVPKRGSVTNLGLDLSRFDWLETKTHYGFFAPYCFEEELRFYDVLPMCIGILRQKKLPIQ